jgi:transposase
MLSSGNVDDRKPVKKMVEKLKGWLMGDCGYISKKLEKQLEQQSLELITRAKKNMKKKIIDPAKEYFLDKRGMIET